MINNKKGFTLIELIVVIAIIGVLVLLATPKFINYVAEAKEANIINDVKVMENKIEEYLIRNDDAFPVTWASLDDNSILTEAIEQDKLYNIKGLVENHPTGTFKEVPNDFINTKVEGSFYVNKDAEIFYVNIIKETELGDTETITNIYTDEGIIIVTNKGEYSYFGGQTLVELFNYIGNKNVIITFVEIAGTQYISEIS